MKRCVLSLERKVGKEFEFRVSEGNEFQSRGPLTEKALLPSDDLTYGMAVMGKILLKSIFKIENKIVQKKYFENNKIKYFTKVFSKYKIK